MWKLLDDIEDKDTVLLSTDEHINFSPRGDLWSVMYQRMVGKKYSALGGVPVRRKISDNLEAEKPAYNNGSPKCACPLPQPCSYSNGSGGCNYVSVTNSGALRAGA